ncbi:MAG: site-specific integrase [Actinobacteria bacterium]|nr:site-specific integrase [Actinomycetota bacterium]
MHCFLNDIGQWGWPQAPDRRLIFPRDTPRRPQPLPRYLPAETDRRLTDALSRSTETLAANALLLARATGLRIGELVDLELDCVHEVPCQGAWLKVPLGKLASERMVPLDDHAVAIIDRIAAARSAGRPLPHPRDGRLVDFLLTHHGRRVTAYALRGTLQRAASSAGIGPVTPHQLRHTYATALINAGVSLQALMALLGHSSAEMSLRYGRLFDATVRADYERALTLAKDRLGPVLPQAPTGEPDTQPRQGRRLRMDPYRWRLGAARRCNQPAVPSLTAYARGEVGRPRRCWTPARQCGCPPTMRAPSTGLLRMLVRVFM